MLIKVVAVMQLCLLCSLVGIWAEAKVVDGRSDMVYYYYYRSYIPPNRMHVESFEKTRIFK